MGGKSSTTTQAVSIPPEVLARYNAVNARAEQAAGTPFQPYSYNPADFVAQMTPTQLAGIQNINYASGQAQPYYEEATNQLMGAQQAGVPYYGAAADIYGQAYYGAQPLNQLALQQYYGGLGAASPLTQAALQNLAYGQYQGQDITGGALSQLGAAQQAAYPYQQMATQYGLAGATPVGPGFLNTAAYMSPYMQGVVAPTAALLNQQNQQAMAGQTANAIRSGAFGGDRAAIAAANLAQQQQLATGKVLGELMQSGYGQALSTAQQQQQLALQAEQANRAAQAAAAQQFLGIGQQGFGQALQAAQQQQAAAQQLFGQGATAAQQQAALAQQLYGQQAGVGQATRDIAQQMYAQGLGLGQAQQGVGQGLYQMGAGTAQQLAALGQGAQAAALQGGQGQMGAGQAQQQTAQAGLQALYNQYLQQQGYPFQVAQFLANVAMGTGALSGSTTTTNQPGGLFSDARLKENIEEVGRTYDDQPIYKYNFKGSPKTEIGLIAQEVEKRHPEAVGKKAGFKTVDYDKATKRAGLGHVIDGEYTVKEGGHVHPEHAGLGFADGGMPYSDPMSNKLEIPNEKPDINKLELPGAAPKGRTAMEDIKDIASTAASIAAIAASDARVKENIEEIGKLHDGQKVYRYNFKGNPEKHIGLIAQEVEHHHPKAVHEHNGLKMVDYDRATEVAAHAARADGGRTGYADGGSPGLVSPSDMAALLQAQAQMFGPYSQANRPMGGAPGAAGFVPAGNLPVSGLAVAKGDLPRQMSTIEQAKQLGDVGKTGVELYKKGKEAGVFGKDEDPLQKELKEYGVFARGGLAGRNGYAVRGTVEGEQEDSGFDLPGLLGGDYEFSGRALAPGAYDEEGKLKPWAQSIVSKVGDIPSEFQKWRETSPNLFGMQTAERPAGLAAAPPVATPPAATPAPAPTPAPAAPQRTAGLAPVKTRDQVQQFMTDVGGEQFVAEPSAPASPTAERDLGLAPSLAGSTVPATTTPAGLAGAKPVATAKAPAEPGKFSKFLEWAKKPENFIPLATGITGTIMAPTRNPLVAAAYGLQSGVQAYQPTLQKQAQLEQTKATTGQTQALTLNQLYQMAGSRNLVPIEDPNGPFSVGNKRYSLAPISAAIKRPAGTSGAATVTGPTVLGNAGTQAANEAGNRFLMASPEEQKSSKEQIDAIAGDAVQAQTDMMDINRFASAASFPRTGAYESGAFFPIKSQAANYYNSLISTFIRDPDLRAKLQIDPQGMTESAIAEKVTTGTAALREAGAGQRSFGALQAFLKATPNQTMPREAMLNLISDMVIHNQQTIDKARYINDFDRRVEASTGLPRSFYATDALQAYNSDNPVTKYQSDRDNLYKVMEKNQYQKVVQLLQNPETRDDMIANLDKRYGAGFHRYFTGARY